MNEAGILQKYNSDGTPTSELMNTTWELINYQAERNKRMAEQLDIIAANDTPAKEWTKAKWANWVEEIGLESRYLSVSEMADAFMEIMVVGI